MPQQPSSMAVRVGERVRDLRLEQGISLRDLSKRSGLAPNTISSLERGKTTAQLHTFARVADALEVELFDLFNVGHDEHAKFVEATRTMTPAELKRVLAVVSART